MRALRILSQDFKQKIVKRFRNYLERNLPGIKINGGIYTSNPAVSPGELVIAERFEPLHEFHRITRDIAREGNDVFALNASNKERVYSMEAFREPHTLGLVGLVYHCRGDFKAFTEKEGIRPAHMLLRQYLEDDTSMPLF